jgi:hypothetical protein
MHGSMNIKYLQFASVLPCVFSTAGFIVDTSRILLVVELQKEWGNMKT